MNVGTYPSYVCPGCHAQLELATGHFVCTRCGNNFRIFEDIPDFRLFPDPYITFADEYIKAERLSAYARDHHLAELIAYYWQLTPEAHPSVVAKHVNATTTSSRWQMVWRQLSRRVAVAASMDVLEIGCGTGGLLPFLSRQARQVVGIDIALRWLVVARQRLREHNTRNAFLACACSEHLPLPSGSFDVVVAIDVLDHVCDPVQTLREVGRVLKPGGLCYLLTPNAFGLGPDPHVWLWGLGWLPQKLRDWYVRKRRGTPYSPIRAVSPLHLRRWLRCASLQILHFSIPDFRAISQESLPTIYTIGAKSMATLGRFPLLTKLFAWISPLIEIVCTVNQADV